MVYAGTVMTSFDDWNKLPDNVVLGKSVNLFKNGVDNALSKCIDKYCYGLWLWGTVAAIV